jgi:2-polyprenyl-6-methoxyphenol hydroxylase-like FAD-dependent oxidoreductase
MLLARQGFDVALVDRADLPSDTLSTHLLARGGLVQLARWGLLDEVVASGAPPIHTMSIVLPDTRIDRAIQPHAGIDRLLAPRRYVLDAILLGAAAAAGATVQTGVSVTGTTTDRTGRVTGIELRDRTGRTGRLAARLVVGADGLRSRIARHVGAAVLQEHPADASVAYSYVAGLDAEGIELHVGDGAVAGVFPTHGGEANVWMCLPGDRARLARAGGGRGYLDLLRDTSPALAARVERASVTAPVRIALDLPNHVLEAGGPGWALVGDAGYHRDPITGHGITDAFRDAELLALWAGRALRGEVDEAGALAAFRGERDEALAPILDVTWQLAQFPPVERFLQLQKRLMGLLEAEAAWLAARPLVPAAADRAAPAA